MLHLVKTPPLIFLMALSTLLVSCEGQNKFGTAQINSEQKCQDCHLEQTREWANSDHGKAVQHANANTVLGNFENQTISVNGVTSSFFKKGDAFWVNTESKDGRLKDFRIEYTFGVQPLQQYLVKMDNGKYQVLPLSWDSRSDEQGGQRWFHIYGDDLVRPTDRLHWTQPLQNWNGMCADCHSSGLKRNYDVNRDTFSTHWDSINVGCKSCHIVAAGHEDKEHEVKQDKSQNGNWAFAENASIAHWVGENGQSRDQSQIETCAACHSRRTPLTDGFDAGGKFLDSFSPALVLPPDYFPDGKVRDENYVWGSFLQSKMYQYGVICSDCHNPHTLGTKAPDNALCAACHKAEVFDTPGHTRHEVGSEAALCVNCHMGERTYMQVDKRRDHSFRVPRPGLGHQIGAPDVCTACHSDKTQIWAQDNIDTWFGTTDAVPLHFGLVVDRVLNGKSGAEHDLKTLLTDDNVPAIIKASLYALLSYYPNGDSLAYLQTGLNSKETLHRIGALKAYEIIPLTRRVEMLLPLLSDPRRAARVEAVRALAGAGQEHKQAERELLMAEQVSAWRGEGRANLAEFYRSRRENQEAIKHYLASLDIDPYFGASFVNLADIYRELGDDPRGMDVLKAGLTGQADDADLNFSMALNLIRQKRPKDALFYLKNANENAPANAHYAYVRAVALNDMGHVGQALSVLETAVKHAPQNANLNYMLALIYQQKGDFESAFTHLKLLEIRFPDNQNIKNQIDVLEKRLKQK